MRTSRTLVLLAFVAAGCPSPASTAPASPTAPTAAGPASHPTAPTAPEAPAADPSGATPPGSPSTTDAMHRHDELAETARAAIVAGDLETFRTALDYEALQPLPGDRPAEGAVFVELAQKGAQATDLTAAATAFGEIGAACAACHRTQPKGRFAPSGFEDAGDDLPERMQLHWWATDALWQGLVGPSDLAWDVGARTLADPNLKAVPGFPKGSAAGGYADELRKAASAARIADGDEARGQALGQVIATCAGCHTALGRGPGFE